MKKEVEICDVCEKRIATNKCSLCKKDLCEECGEEIVVGTIIPFLCKNCSARLDRVVNPKNFWKDFNKNENMEEKILEYINRNLMLKNLNEGEEDEEDEYSSSVRKGILKRRIKKVRIGRIR